MEIESEELQKYIHSSITAIKKGIEEAGFKLNKPIEFDLAVTNTREGGGGLKIYVAKAESKLKSEEISHIKLKLGREMKRRYPLSVQGQNLILDYNLD